MKWYYAEGKKPIGPFDANEFLELAKDGTIKPDALVWRSGMKVWKPLSEVELPEAAPPEPAATESTDPDPNERAMDSEDAAVYKESADEEEKEAAAEIEAEYERMEAAEICAECGRSFGSKDMVRSGENWICSYCQPVLMRKTDHMSQVGQMEYAGFMVRAGAKIIDIAILWAIGITLSLVAGLLFPLRPGDDPSVALAAMLNALQLIIAVSYTTYFLGKYSATPGKMACRLKVVTPEGDRISYGRACGRYFAEILSSLIFCIGYLMAIFDEERRTLHDRIVGTRVIRTG